MFILIGICFFCAGFYLFACKKNAFVKIDAVLFYNSYLDITIRDSFIERVIMLFEYSSYISRAYISSVKEKIREKVAQKKEKDDFGHLFVELLPLWTFKNWALFERNKSQDNMGIQCAQVTLSPYTGRISLVGNIILPRRAYVGDSCVISLELVPEFMEKDTPAPKLEMQNSEGNIIFALSCDDGYRRLHINLIGIGVDITPIESEFQDINSSACSYSWGCHFSSSGEQVLSLRCELVTSYDNGFTTYDKKTLNKKIKVVQFGHMTSRQIKMYAIIGGTISGVLAVIAGLSKLGLSIF